MIFFSPNPWSYARRLLSAALLIGVSALLLNTAVFSQEQDIVAIFNEGQNLHEKGDLIGAIKLYDKAIMIEPAFPEAQYQRGIAQLALGQTVEAEKSFRRAVEIKPDWTLPMTSLGSLLVKKGETAEAARILNKVIEIEPQNSAAFVALADLHKRANSSPETLQQLLTAIRSLTSKMNSSASLWSAQADFEIALGKWSDAKVSVAKSLLLDPKYLFALLQAADIALVDADTDRAKQITAKLEALSEAPDSLNFLRAKTAVSDGNLDEALRFLDAIKTPGSFAIDLRKVIDTARSTNALELEKQLETRSTDGTILGRLCTLHRKDDPAKALEYCRRANVVEPGKLSHAVGYGAALVQAKKYEAAVDLFRRIIEKAPDNATAHANLATALFQLKRNDEARAEFQWLVNAQPKSAGAYLFLGILHDQSAQYLDAMANYQQYLRLANSVENKLDIEKVNLRLPSLQKLIKGGKGAKP